MRIRLKKSVFGGELQAPPSEEDLLRKLFLATVLGPADKGTVPVLFSQRLRWAAETAEALGAGIFRQKDGVLVKPLPKEGEQSVRMLQRRFRIVFLGAVSFGGRGDTGRF